MDPLMPQEELGKRLRERFQQLPKVVQNSIKSADVQKQLRALAETSNLHIDQWQVLENEVMLTLLGFQVPEDLPDELKKNLDLPQEAADTLAAKISEIVFQPIREELERELENPEAKAAEVSGVEAARKEILSEQLPPVAPGTQPSPPQTERSVRAPISEAYRAGEPSSVRKSIVDDPYRESPA